MAVVTFDSTPQIKQDRRQSRVAVTSSRAMLGAVVCNQFRHTAAAAGSQLVPDAGCNSLGGEVSSTTETPSVEFGPLASDIVSDTIPAFFIGRNRAGLWVAREARGRVGGVFLFRRSALRFAQAHSEANGCATVFPSERFELDLGNSGNPLADRLGSLIRLARPSLSLIKRVCLYAMFTLFAGAALGAIIAVKEIAHFSRFGW